EGDGVAPADELHGGAGGGVEGLAVVVLEPAGKLVAVGADFAGGEAGGELGAVDVAEAVGARAAGHGEDVDTQKAQEEGVGDAADPAPAAAEGVGGLVGRGPRAGLERDGALGELAAE